MGVSVERVPESDWPTGVSVRDYLNCSLKAGGGGRVSSLLSAAFLVQVVLSCLSKLAKHGTWELVSKWSPSAFCFKGLLELLS